MEGATPGSAEPSHRGEEAKEEEEEEEGRTEGRSPLDSGCVVCKRTPLNRTEDVVDGKWGMLGPLGVRGTASVQEEGWRVELSAWTSGRPLGPADTPPSVVVSSFKGRARPRPVSARTKDDDVLLMSAVRDLHVGVVVLNEEILFPPFVFALVNVGAVVLTPPFVFSVESFGLMTPRTPSVLASEYEGAVEVELKTSLVADVEEKGALPLKSALPLVSGGTVPSGGRWEVLWCAVFSEWLRT